MTSVFRKRLEALATAVLLSSLAAAVGCTSPCEQLADHICECKPNGSEQNACKEQVRAATAQHDVTSAEQQYCSTLLDKCSCNAVDKNDLYSCGLSKETPRR
jgi:hypothetical protein